MEQQKKQFSSMVDLLKQLVETESPSNDKSGVDRVGQLVAEHSRRLGGQVQVHQHVTAGNMVEARFGSSGRDKPILFLCHMDTVFPVGTLKTMPFYEKSGRIFGPGTLDMKGGIYVGLTALENALASGGLKHPVTALFTPDEELGSETSRPLIEALARESALVLVLEPGMPDGSIKVWRKGVGDYTIKVHGRAAHAGGDHEKGRNAIEEAAHQVIAIQQLTDYFRGTTLNVGRIKGGTASNVVPAEAVFDVDLRVMQPEEAERIKVALYGLQPVLPDTTLEVTGSLNRPPMPFDEAMKVTFEKAQAIAARHGIDLRSSGTGGASDANFVAPLHIPVLDGLGPAGDGAHSEREYIFEESLLERARLVEALIMEW